MVFSGITFLYYFLPVFLMVYFLVPKAFKNLVLLVASLLFYGWGEPKYVYLMCATILIGYIGGLVIDRYRNGKLGKIALYGLFLFALDFYFSLNIRISL